MNNRYYALLLSTEQLDFLSDNQSGADRMRCLASLISMALTSNLEYKKKGFSAILGVGQAVVSDVELSHLWNLNRKTVSKMIDRFNHLGLITSVRNNRTSIHNIRCVSAFYAVGTAVSNPFCQSVPGISVSPTLSVSVSNETQQKAGNKAINRNPNDNRKSKAQNDKTVKDGFKEDLFSDQLFYCSFFNFQETHAGTGHFFR